MEDLDDFLSSMMNVTLWIGTWESLSHRIQSLGDVIHQVLAILAADTEANETFRYLVASPTGSPFGGSMHAAETGRFNDQLARLQEVLCTRSVGKHKADHRTIVAHLVDRYRMRRVMRQSGIAQSGNVGTGR